MFKNPSKLLFFFSLVFLTHWLTAQNAPDSLILKYRSLSVSTRTDSLKVTYSDSLRTRIKMFLDSENSFSTPLNQVPYLGDIYSPDEAFRLITWNITLKDGTYDYYCFLQLPPESDGSSKWFELNDHHKQLTRVEYRSLNKDNWYGSLYYSIIPFKKDKKTMYVLLGWEGNNNYSNKKVIESLYFNHKQEPLFGKAVFETSRINKRRIVFEYSKEAYFMLRYNADLKQIIFNRLEPSKPELEGIYSFYQPTMTYDSYHVKKGNWILEQDVNPRNKKSNKSFHNPEDLKKPKK